MAAARCMLAVDAKAHPAHRWKRHHRMHSTYTRAANMLSKKVSTGAVHAVPRGSRALSMQQHPFLALATRPGTGLTRATHQEPPPMPPSMRLGHQPCPRRAPRVLAEHFFAQRLAAAS